MEGNELKKKNKLLWYLIPIVLVIALLVAGFFLLFNNKKEEKEEKKPNLQDDYYESINYGSINYPFIDAQRNVTTNLMMLIKSIESDTTFTNENYINFIELYDDKEGREQAGIEALKPYFEEIDNASNLDEFTDIMLKVDYDLGVTSLLNWELGPNLYDTSQSLIIFEPVLLEDFKTFTLVDGMPSGLEFFTSEEYSKYKETFVKARIEFLKLYGYDEEKATQVSNDINEFAKVLQDKSISINELHGNITKYFKLYSKSDIDNTFHNLPIDKFLSKYNISDNDRFAVIDEGHLIELDNYYTEEHLPVMKEILKVLILERVASINSNSEYLKVFADCYASLTGEAVNGVQISTFYEQMILKPKLMGSYLNIKYDEKFFTEVEKLEIVELINKVKDQYKEVINSSTWMSDSTKQEAIKKLDNMKVNVGFVQRKEYPVDAKLIKKDEGGTLLGNYILLNQDESSKIALKINDVYYPEVSHFMVNAYYNQTDNSINFPSSFREMYRDITDKYEIYGYAGAVVAHEISHAFDSNGSLYDEHGNLNNWWTDEDKAKYDELKQAIIDYYSNYEVLGLKVNGEHTVPENIADLGGVKTILSIMESENATKEDYIKFFEAYAKLWNQKVNKAELEIAILSDNHSPNKVRTNAVLSSMDKFYEVYDIKESDKMYVAKDKRVSLW